MIHFLISCLLLSAIGAMVKSLHGSASPVFILAIRSLIHLLTVFPEARRRFIPSLSDRDLVLRALCAFSGMLLYFISLQLNPLILATAFFWISPVFNQSLQSRRFEMSVWAPVAFVILFVLMNPTLLGGLSFWGMSAGFLSSILIGASYYFLGRATKRLQAPQVEASFAGLMAALSLPGLILMKPATKLLFEPRTVVILGGISVAASLYQKLIVRGYAKLSPIHAAMVQATCIPILSAVVDLTVFNAKYTPISTILLVSGLTLYAILRIARAQPKRQHSVSVTAN